VNPSPYNFSTLNTAMTGVTQALQSQQRAMSKVSQNVANVSTPGYARQVPTTDQDSIFSRNYQITDRRAWMLESQVRARQNTLAGATEARTLAERLEASVPVGQGSVPAALDQLYASFSELSVNPSQATSRRAVLEQAQRVASVFRKTAGNLQKETAAADSEVQRTITQINNLSREIADINTSARKLGLTDDPQVQAQRTELLENLAELVPINPIFNDDGSLTVFMTNGEPLILAEEAMTLRAVPTGSGMQIFDSRNVSIEQTLQSQAQGGKLASQLEYRNSIVPQTQTQLDGLATAFATNINSQWIAGLDASGNAPTTGLFTWNATSPAVTLQVNALSENDVPAASAGNPGGNGNALALARTRESPLIGSSTATEVYADLAAGTGRRVSRAESDERLESGMLAVAQNLRDRVSGVSLDQEATELVQLQTAYEASARVLRTINELSQTVIDMMR
jgi:flagellar hook-associated protein 1